MATSTQPLPRVGTIVSERKPRSLWADAWNRLRKNKAAVIGLIVVVLFVLVALFAPLLAPHNPVAQVPNNGFRQPFWVDTGNPKTTGTMEYPLGTDILGRDLLSRLLYGARVSLLVGLVPTIIVAVVGVIVGLVSGYAGGKTDMFIQRVVEIIAAFPDTLFVITLAVAFRETVFGKALNGLLLIFIALSITAWVGLSRLVRGQVLSLKQKEFIEAARTVGTPTPRIIFDHVFPNTLAPIIVSLAFTLPANILAEAILSIVGVGMRPSINPQDPFPASWGVLLLDGYANISSGPWMLLFPVLCIAIVSLSFTFLGDGLRDALDPRDN